MSLAGVLLFVLYTFLALLWVRFIVDWVQVFAREWTPKGPLLVALEGAYSVTDPPILALRKAIPPLRLGSIVLDLSFLLVMFGTYLLIQIVRIAML